uniref:Laminin subunit alpha-2 n=1 Tax=Parascaris univalens TaxID=6257 RepID=A0A915BQN1_PARUN
MGLLMPTMSVLFLFCQLLRSLNADEYYQDSYQEFASSEERGLFPNIFNLATNALIWADATCGQHHREVYCKLVEHVFNRQPQCDVCDMNDVQKRHPIEFAIDGTPKWWQSPSLANGLEYERVNITIDLRQEYQVAYIIVKSAIAPRPGTWVLEKSLDGVTYQPWQYYATSDAECMRHFGVPATVGVPRFTRDDEVICTSYFSKLDPLENGEIHTSLVNGRPTAEASSELLQQFTRARYVRLKLLSPRTLNADLMIINHHGSSNRLDKSVTRRYFYAIKDISIGGQCICYGHAESCPPDPVTGQFRCDCRHNTCGESCNVCCPLFNQLPWKQGTQSHPNICQACQCFNHADRCEYDPEVERLGLSVTPEGIFEGGGRCISCKHNTDGINCERCKWTFYRPSGITHYREDACRACDCDPVGSEHGNCVRDETSAVNGQHPGDCICKPGFGGRRCDRCAAGYRNHPKCEPCPCNQAGSVNFDTCEEEKCVCKANVEGIYCDRCRAGTINLNVNNPQGCQPCFCFGLGLKCFEKQWATGQIRDNLGWRLTDLSGQSSVEPKTENAELLMYTTNDHKDGYLYYWKAPEKFLGNLLNSYGGMLHYYVYFVPSNHGASVPIADLIMEGNGIKLEYYSRQDFFPRENMSVQIPMKEGTGWYNSHLRVPVDKNDLMRTLADVKYMLVRAMYHQNQLQSSIYGLALDTAVEPSDAVGSVPAEDELLRANALTNTLMRGVEVCECPENFAGNSCEMCKAGYRRVNNQLYGGQCEKCACQGHSDQCDPFTGHCLNCRENTTGARCEQCLPGHYGNPSLGGELGQCRPCACPTIDNNRSSQCALTQLVVGGAAASGEDAYVCTACETGYDGNKCEMCADGFYGDPLAKGGSCKACECNDNIDSMAIGNCDRSTGRCLKCIYNTAGDHCEQCKENHWGSAKDKSCQSCDCHPKGAVASNCDNVTGACECRQNYEGMQCDRCKDGHGDIENFCPPCNCNATGAIGSECDQISGQCACKMGVFGKQCDMCRASYFNFSESGCHFCHCNSYGSIDDGRCDNVTGKCECRVNVDGNMCEKCVDGFFNITSGNGCQECGCDEQGSEGIHCDMHTGQCACKPGVTGLKCNECAPNHYGLDETGCKECQICPAPGQVCDPVTGDCVCPPNTVGEMCENCTKNAWNYHPLKGCTLCDCSKVGADGPDCNPLNGQCKCRAEYVGLRCDLCTHGFFNFPECMACNCDLAGTDPKACGASGSCLCDENGQCPCKKNVKGLKCDTCDASSFSLERSNPVGCTECFCFNRTYFCVQSSLVWQQVYALDRQVVFSEPWEYYTKKHNINILKEHPSRYNSYPTDATPLYWPLPRSFLGDRTTSYNGFIRFKIHNDDNRHGINGVVPDAAYFRYFAQVILVGNHRIILEHIPDEISETGRYKVRLHESQWRSRLSPDVPVTRKQLMVALQNVQGIYIRATYNYPARGDAASIKEMSIDVAVWENTTDSVNATAIGVEMCECPKGYAGNSCQNPAEGYCRRRQPDYLNSENDLALIGWPEACSCNGHSATCDSETCRCTNCEHNTFGDYCQYCKPGYHGDALIGGSNACTKCACPLPENSFSDTCVAVSHGRGYMCDACKPGYTGMYCESCVTGYFGDPNVPGGFCEECACHPDGSRHGACDPVNGQCECREGVTGRDCSLCHERHAFVGGVCSSCDQGCTKELMSAVDELEETMDAQNFSNLRPIPWKRVARIGNTTEGLLNVLNTIKVSENDVEEMLDGLDTKNRYASEVNAAVDQAKFLLERSNKSSSAVNDIVERGLKLNEEAQKTYADVFRVVQQLHHYTTHGGSKHDNSAIDHWILEAETYLNATRERGIYIEKRYNRGVIENEKALELLKKITSNKLNDTTFERLRDRLDEFRQWIEDYRDTIWDSARQNTVSANKISTVVAKRIDRFNEVEADIAEMLSKANDEIADAEEKVTAAKTEKILNMYDDFKHVNESLLPSVKSRIDKCRGEADKYSQLLGEYRRHYVDASDRHAKELVKEAASLQRSFVDTKVAAENTIRASNSYKEIVGALKNASSAAEEAKKAAEDAYIDADPSSDTSMVNLALQSKNDSLELRNKAHTLNLEELANERATYEERLKELKDFVSAAQKKKTTVGDQYQSFDDQHDRMTGLVNVAADAEERADYAKNKAEELATQVDEIDLSASKLTNFAGQSIRSATDDVRQANEQLKSAMETVENVREQTESDAERIIDLGKRIDELKYKIKEAREMASRIRISVKSDEAGLCRRSFISPMHPSPSNTISIKYRPTLDVPDSLIFLTRTKSKRTQASEYIALELRDRRMVAHWNIGGETRKVTNTHTINYITPSDRVTWYHIDLDRVGDTVTVTVGQRQTITGEEIRAVDEPTSVTFPSSGGDGEVILNTVPGETRIQFGCDPKLADELGLSTNRFRGTIGKFTVDGQDLPLWAFSQTNKECEGQFPVTPTRSIGYMFRDGFAQVHLPTSERPGGGHFTIVFSAYSSDGLLYFRGNPNNGDFVSVELRDGHVIFKINLGNGSYTSVESKKAYSDGRQHSIFAGRNATEVHLQVDGEEDRSRGKIGGGNTMLNINDADHFVGGVPFGFNKSAFERFDIHWNGYFGCIQSVKPPGTDLDLDSPVRSLHKQPGCLFEADGRLELSDRVVGFSKPGYLVSQGVLLSDNSTLSFDFRTRAANATLIYQSSKLPAYGRKREKRTLEGQGYLAFYLYRGYLVVHLGTDASQRSKVLTLRSESSYNDGQLHSVFLSRQGSIVRLRADDREIASGTLADQATIGSPSSQIFIGGFPPAVKPPSNEMPVDDPLTGCVSDIYSEYRIVQIIPEAYFATIGYCAAEQAFDTSQSSGAGKGTENHVDVTVKTLPTDETAVKTTVVPSKKVSTVATKGDHPNPPPAKKQCAITKLADTDGDGAARFGLTEASHSRINFEGQYPDVNQFKLEFSFRTVQPSSMLWIWANYKNYTRYFFLNLVDGLLQLEVKGHKQPKSFTYESGKLNDDMWHNVHILKQGREILMKVDAMLAQSMKDVPNPKVMRKRMYVGGVISRHRKQFNFNMPAFVGCIRDFLVDDEPRDLLASTRDVIPCSMPSKSIYIHDGGYLIFDPLRAYDNRDDVLMSIQFRAGVDEGLIMGLMTSKNPESIRVALYLKDGMTTFELVNSTKRRDLKHEFGANLCDGRWHNASVHLSAHDITLTIDEKKMRLPTKTSVESIALFRSLPVNIGGVATSITEKIGVSSLIGCFRQLRLSGKRVSLNKAKKTNKIAPSACPYMN